MAAVKCDKCSFNAVVYDGRYNSWLCAGHAIVYVVETIEAVKLDKCSFVAVSDFQDATLGMWFCPSCSCDNDRPVCFGCGHKFLKQKVR